MQTDDTSWLLWALLPLCLLLCLLLVCLYRRFRLSREKAIRAQVELLEQAAKQAAKVAAVAKTQDKPEAVSATTECSLTYDCFLTHDWGEDEDGRDNHARVARICAALKAEGLRPWFDEDQMRGDINSKMVEGIEGSRSIVCFITKRYLQKAGGNGPGRANDNCKFEFDYGCRRKGVEKMISVVMERGCRNPNEWSGTVGGKLGGTLYVDLSSDGDAFDLGVKRLAAEIRLVSAGGGVGGQGWGGDAPPPSAFVGPSYTPVAPAPAAPDHFTVPCTHLAAPTRLPAPTQTASPGLQQLQLAELLVRMPAEETLGVVGRIGLGTAPEILLQGHCGPTEAV